MIKNSHRLSRYVSIMAVAVAMLAFAIIPAQAGPSPGLCQSSDLRGAVPSNFPVEGCVDGSSIWLRNNLSVPITLRITGASGPPIPVQLDQSTAAIVTRKLVSNANVLMPNDLVRIPLGSEKGQVYLADLDAGTIYVEALTLSSFLPLGRTQAAYDAFAGLITDLDNTVRGYQQCILGKNVVQQTACSIAASASASFAVGKAVALGVAQGVASVVLNAVAWGQQVDSQVPDISTVVHGARTLDQAAIASPMTQPAPAPVSTQTAPTASEGAPSAASLPTPQAAESVEPAPVSESTGGNTGITAPPTNSPPAEVPDSSAPNNGPVSPP